MTRHIYNKHKTRESKLVEGIRTLNRGHHWSVFVGSLAPANQILAPNQTPLSHNELKWNKHCAKFSPYLFLQTHFYNIDKSTRVSSHLEQNSAQGKPPIVHIKGWTHPVGVLRQRQWCLKTSRTCLSEWRRRLFVLLFSFAAADKGEVTWTQSL